MQAGQFDMIALVASAGGLEAVSRVLPHLPADLPAAIVVGMHLGGHGSMLDRILRRRLKRPVEWVADGAALLPGQVYVCPPLQVVEVLPDRTCVLRALEAAERYRPLDHLLSSLAASVRARTLVVVLTGLGRDGAAGALAVHQAGGIVLAQSEDTAEQPFMPRAAVEAGAVDLVLPLDDVGRVVADVVLSGQLPRAD